MATYTKLTNKQEEQLMTAMFKVIAEEVEKEKANQIDVFNHGGHADHNKALKTVMERMKTAVDMEDERALARNNAKGKFNYLGSWPEETVNILSTQSPDGMRWDKNYDYLNFLSKRPEFSALKASPLLTKDPRKL